jgi:hypothetical protein
MVRSVVERLLDRRQPNWRNFGIHDAKVSLSCFFHDGDGSPSMSVHLDTGYVHCFGCHLVGNLEEMLTETPGEGFTASDFVHITDEIVELGCNLLDMHPDAREHIEKQRGVSEATWRRFRIGLGGDRLWLPVMGSDGTWHNIRKYKWLYGEYELARKNEIPKMLPYSKHIIPAKKLGLFPLQILTDTPMDVPIVVAEGEWDALVAIDRGFPTVTGTGGAGTWRTDWGHLLQGRHVLICFDCDPPGLAGMNVLANKLRSYVESVRKIVLPLPGTKADGKDISDFFVKFGRTAAEFQALIDAATYEPRVLSRANAKISGKPPKPPAVPKPSAPTRRPKNTQTSKPREPGTDQPSPTVNPQPTDDGEEMASTHRLQNDRVEDADVENAEEEAPEPDDESQDAESPDDESPDDPPSSERVGERLTAWPDVSTLQMEENVALQPYDSATLAAVTPPPTRKRRKDRSARNGSNGHAEGWIPSENDPRYVDLVVTGAAEHVGEWTKVLADVIGKDGAPYQLPVDGSFSCHGGLSICKACPIPKLDGVVFFHIDTADSVLFEMRDLPDMRRDYLLRKSAGIPAQCSLPRLAVQKYATYESIKTVPVADFETLDVLDVSQANIVRNVFTLTYDLEVNKRFELVGRVMPDPKYQTASMFITKVHPIEEQFETFKLTPELAESLAVFRPDGYVPGVPHTLTLEAIRAKFAAIAHDISCNVTKIWGRDDVLCGFDLVVHSVLSFEFCGKRIQRGYVEGIIYGDSRTGKSESASSLVRHYRAGEIVTVENASVAGLLGGLEQIGHNDNQWTLQWGSFPRNDRKLVVIDEASGIDVKIIGALTSMRSSGIAELGKIKSGKAPARVRSLWMGNPRDKRSMASHSSDIEALERLIGQPADIARFDFALPLREGEVPSEWINRRNPPHREQVFTSDICSSLVMWSWSRSDDDVVFTDEAVQACLDHALEMGRRYHSSCPLVTVSEQRLKLARLAAACAARLFCTTQDTSVLLVDRPHVDFVVEFLDAIYNKSPGGYGFYSVQQFQEENLGGMDDVGKEFDRLPPGTARKLHQQAMFDAPFFRTITGLPRETSDALFSLLVQRNCLRKAFQNQFAKGGGFTQWLSARLLTEDQTAAGATVQSPSSITPLKAEDF